MKRHEPNLDALLDRHLGLYKAATRENPAAAQEAILDRLRFQAETATKTESAQDVQPIRDWRLRLMAAGAGAVLIFAVLVMTIHRSEPAGAQAVLETGDGSLYRVNE